MALGRAFLSDLIKLKRSEALDGASRVIEIGAQQLSDSFLEAGDLLDELYSAYGRSRRDLGRPSGTATLADDAPSSREFWQSIGLDYAAIDYDGHRDSIALDLNCDAVPDALRGAFDLVVNTGTTEHVANQGNAFQVVHDLTCKGGVMYHEVPAGGMWDHGLVSYNPKFFLLLEKQNDYKLLSMHERRENDMTIRVAFRKRLNRVFVVPLDVLLEIMPTKYRQPWRTLRRIVG